MRFRLYPTPEQETGLSNHCAQARFVWNLGLEQRNLYRRSFGPTPNFVVQSRQLTEARAANDWLTQGSYIVQQQALRDLDQAFRNWWGGSHGRPTWRVRCLHEGFRIVGQPAQRWERVSRRWGQVLIPKVGWVRFRWTCHPGEPKSYRVKRDAAGRWWISFAVIPPVIPPPNNGSVVGVDRGVIHAFTTSDGEHVDVPGLRPGEKARLLRLQRKLARQQKGSNRRERTKHQIAVLRHREINRRKDVVEKLSTRLATDHDVICVENLDIQKMTRSAKGTVEKPGVDVALARARNREILASGWGLLARRLEQKAPDRVFKVDPAFTSQQCHECGHACPENRKSQAVFRCGRCNHTANADVNAAKNIAARYAVNGRGDLVGSLKRQPETL